MGYYDDQFTHTEIYKNISEAIRPQVAALRAKITTMLRARKATRFVGDQERGRLDAASLYGLRLGDKRVFAQQVPTPEMDTAIQIIVDMSGSMGGHWTYDGKMAAHGGSKSDFARAVAIALSETLDALNIPFEVLGYHNNGGYVHGITREEEMMYNRFSAVHLEVFKAFETPYKQVRNALVQIDGGGDNTDGDAIMLAARRIAVRQESRKIMIVLSDGMPLCGGSDARLLERHLREVIAKIINSGIEIFGLGIQTNAPSKFYPDWAVVSDLNKLADTLFRMMKSYLVHGQKVRRSAKLPVEERW